MAAVPTTLRSLLLTATGSIAVLGAVLAIRTAPEGRAVVAPLPAPASAAPVPAVPVPAPGVPASAPGPENDPVRLPAPSPAPPVVSGTPVLPDGPVVPDDAGDDASARTPGAGTTAPVRATRVMRAVPAG